MRVRKQPEHRFQGVRRHHHPLIVCSIKHCSECRHANKQSIEVEVCSPGVNSCFSVISGIVWRCLETPNLIYTTACLMHSSWIMSSWVEWSLLNYKLMCLSKPLQHGTRIDASINRSIFVVLFSVDWKASGHSSALLFSGGRSRH